VINETKTNYGTVFCAAKEVLFAKAIDLIAEQRAVRNGNLFDLALSGGSTPQEWYRWCVARQAFPERLLKSMRFTVSDERCVPLHSEQSNFGQLDRLLLTPLKVSASQHMPWPVHLLPREAADEYVRSRTTVSGRVGAYDVCFLGMGDDGHTASIFPQSSLLSDAPSLFAAVDVPGKGWRLTVTPAGLAACGMIIIMVLGAGKASMLRRVFSDNHNPAVMPVQLTRQWADRVVWLTDQVVA
jgi:6-phosphogluconolactonase